MDDRIAELIVALQDAKRLLAFAGCPTEWIDKVINGNAGEWGAAPQAAYPSLSATPKRFPMIDDAATGVGGPTYYVRHP